MIYVSVLTGSEETESGVFTSGSWALHYRGLHHSAGLPFPHGPALGLGLHPRVNTTPTTLFHLQLRVLHNYKLCIFITVCLGQTRNSEDKDSTKRE